MLSHRSFLGLSLSLSALSLNQAFVAPHCSSSKSRAVSGLIPSKINPTFANRPSGFDRIVGSDKGCAMSSPSLTSLLWLNRDKTALQGSLWPDSDYPVRPINTPLRLCFQLLGQSAYPIYEVMPRGLLPEFSDKENTDVLSVEIANILEPGTIYIAFSESDVHFGEITEDRRVRKLIISDCPLTPAKISYSNGGDRSGLFFVPDDIPSSLREAFYQQIKEAVESNKKRSSIEAVINILSDSGCQLSQLSRNSVTSREGGVDQDLFMRTRRESGSLESLKNLPELFQAILDRGLSYEGELLPARIISTTPTNLQSLKRRMDCADLMAPIHHLKSIVIPSDDRALRYPPSEEFQSSRSVDSSNGDIRDENRSIPLAAARASAAGALIREHVTPHVLFKIELDPDMAERFLPRRLRPFDQKNPDLMTRIKKDILFPSVVARAVHQLMSESFDPAVLVTGEDLLNLVAYQNRYSADESRELNRIERDKPQRFNCVIDENSFIIGQLNAGFEPIDDVLSKHVLLGEYKNVRFAGEVYAEGGTLFLTRNSGSYRPSEADLRNAVLFLETQFPSINVKGDFTKPN